MAKPIAPADGIAFAFPDVCKTPAGTSMVPVPYPNVAQLKDANLITNKSDRELKVGGKYVLLKDAKIDKTTGDEAGSGGGVKSGKSGGPCTLTQGSETVVYGPDKSKIVRFLDATEQNDNNANGFVLSAFPTVMVGD